MVELTPEERAKRAADNEKASAEARKRASEAQMRDIQNGQRPVSEEIQQGLRERLEREDFTQKPE